MLPRRTADARIDTLLGDLMYSFSPMDPLQPRLKLRSYREKNKTLGIAQREGFAPHAGDLLFVGAFALR